VSQFADLHIHSCFSDGSDAPEEIVAKAQNQGLVAIALTDHDTVAGVLPAIEAGRRCGLEVIPGIEFSTEVANRDIHILGYFLDIRYPELHEQLARFQKVRRERIVKMVEQLNRLGVDNISADEILEKNPEAAIGRPHLAAQLLKKGWVKDIPMAFEKYLAEDAPAYVPKYKQTPFEAIALIRRAGGVAVLAHPMITNRDELIPQMIEAGLAGIEVYYPNCPPHVSEFYQKLAHKHGLALSGGSDYHGESKNYIYVGKVCVPYEWVEELKKCVG
jgi:3',5'-nucleoside bisphosphate phosphatase